MVNSSSYSTSQFNQRILETNSLIIVLYLFQYGLLAPFSILFDNQVALLASTIILVTWAVILNKSVNIQVWPLYIIPLLILIIKRPFEFRVEDIDVSWDYIISFLTIGVSAIYLGSLKFSLHKFIYYGVLVSLINLISLGLIPFTQYYGETINYMKFGYGILPSVLFLFIYVLRSIRIRFLSLSLLLASIFLMIVFGARGATVAFICFIIFYIYLGPVSYKIKLYSTIFIALLLLFFVPLLDRLIELMDYYEFSSYSIEKIFKLFLDDEATLSSSSSGRDKIYSTAFNRIYENPFFGSPFNSCYVDTGVEYYHNFFLDLLVNFGFIFTGFLFFFLGYQIVRLRKVKRNYLYEVFLVLFTLSIIRLMLSSNFWQRPEFWLLFSFLITQRSKVQGQYLRLNF